MKLIETAIKGAYIIEPEIEIDNRGTWFVTYHQKDLSEKLGYEINFVQENHCQSHRNVLRGWHYQIPPFAQAKLIRCTEGRILDLALDLRKDSPSFGKHIKVDMSDTNYRHLFIPRGVAHGVLNYQCDSATIQYKCDNLNNEECDRGVNPLCPEVGAVWEVPESELVISDRDRNFPVLSKGALFENSNLY